MREIFPTIATPWDSLIDQRYPQSIKGLCLKESLEPRRLSQTHLMHGKGWSTRKAKYNLVFLREFFSSCLGETLRFFLLIPQGRSNTYRTLGSYLEENASNPREAFWGRGGCTKVKCNMFLCDFPSLHNG